MCMIMGPLIEVIDSNISKTSAEYFRHPLIYQQSYVHPSCRHCMCAIRSNGILKTAPRPNLWILIYANHTQQKWFAASCSVCWEMCSFSQRLMGIWWSCSDARLSSFSSLFISSVLRASRKKHNSAIDGNKSGLDLSCYHWMETSYQKSIVPYCFKVPLPCGSPN